MKEQKRRFWSAVLLVLLMSVSTGCDRASETLSEWKQDFKQDVAMDDRANTSENRLEVPNPDDITIEETYEPVQTIGTPVSEVTVSLYFADAAQKQLVKTEKRIPKVEGMARATVETLLEGPEEASGLVAAIPGGTSPSFSSSRIYLAVS